MERILAPLVKKSNRATPCLFISASHNSEMAKKAKITEENLEESRLLKALFGKYKKDLSQEEFGHTFDIGTQGMVWPYLNGRAALNTDAAIKFARGLARSVEDFSPRLAKGLHSVPAIKLDAWHTEVRETPRSDYKSNIRSLPDKQDEYTTAILAILAATDEKGRVMALGAVRAALAGYVPARANHAK